MNFVSLSKYGRAPRVLGEFFATWLKRNGAIGLFAPATAPYAAGNRHPRTWAMAYIDERDAGFLSQVAALPGWLQPYAAKITVALMHYQKEIGVAGSFFEIGVYAGKYLSLLYRASRANGRALLGIDPFEHFSTADVSKNIGAHKNDARVRFLKGFSSDFRAYDILPYLPGKAQFVSLDGSHDAVDVLGDLKLAHDVLHPKGIVALDDFINTECLGVLEATCRFLNEKPGLVPFLYTSGKLFLAPVHCVRLYYDFVERFAAEDTGDPASVALTNLRRQNREWGQTAFFGYSVLVI